MELRTGSLKLGKSEKVLGEGNLGKIDHDLTFQGNSSRRLPSRLSSCAAVETQGWEVAQGEGKRWGDYPAKISSFGPTENVLLLATTQATLNCHSIHTDESSLSDSENMNVVPWICQSSVLSCADTELPTQHPHLIPFPPLRLTDFQLSSPVRS